MYLHFFCNYWFSIWYQYMYFYLLSYTSHIQNLSQNFSNLLTFGSMNEYCFILHTLWSKARIPDVLFCFGEVFGFYPKNKNVKYFRMQQL